MLLDLFALFSCVNKEAVLSVAVSIVFFNQFVRFLFEGGFYSRKYGSRKRGYFLFNRHEVSSLSLVRL